MVMGSNFNFDPCKLVDVGSQFPLLQNRNNKYTTDWLELNAVLFCKTLKYHV